MNSQTRPSHYTTKVKVGGPGDEATPGGGKKLRHHGEVNYCKISCIHGLIRTSCYNYLTSSGLPSCMQKIDDTIINSVINVITDIICHTSNLSSKNATILLYLH